MTPHFFTRTLAAGASEAVAGYGRYLTFFEVTAGATVEFSIGDEAYQRLAGPLTIDVAEQHYDHIQIRNAGGAPATIIGYFSPVRIGGSSQDLTAFAAILAAINAGVVDLAALEVLSTAANVDLAALEVLQTTMNATLNELKPYTTNVRIPLTALAITGVGATQLIVANALNREVEIVADFGNADLIYIATTNDVTAALAITALQAGGSWNRKWKGDVYACGAIAAQNAMGSVWRE